MKVMSLLDLRPRKLGSFEDYTISLSRSLTSQGGQSVVVFKELPPEPLRPQHLDAGSLLETKPFNSFGPNSATALRALVRRYRPQVVHFYFVNLMSLDVVAAAVSRGVKVVFTDEQSDKPKERTALRWHALRASKRAFSSFVDQVIAPSDYVKSRLVREGVSAKRITTIYNGINVERFRNAHVTEDVRAKYAIGPSTVMVVSISQLIPEKGVGYLIDAAGLALGQGADLAFIHVGDGRCAAEYRAKVQGLGIEKRFIFAGLLNLPEIAGILRECDIFTLPCTWGEAFSLVILEALAAGKPAIVTRVGGNVEAVEDGQNGLVVPPHDAGALAAALMTLHDSPERRQAMGRESAMRSSYFSVNHWVDQTIDLYRRLV
jgi:glycosyltransferase involved in cell wall biosynthesis